jgi:hypothetical protein
LRFPQSSPQFPSSPEDLLVSAAATLLAEVEAAGAVLKVRGGKLVASGAPLPVPLVERLRASKAEVLAMLAPPALKAASSAADGTRCRYCGEAMGWPRPVGIVFADGTAAHHACDERAEVERLRRQAALGCTPEAQADAAELTIRGETLP